MANVLSKAMINSTVQDLHFNGANQEYADVLLSTLAQTNCTKVEYLSQRIRQGASDLTYTWRDNLAVWVQTAIYAESRAFEENISQ